MPSQLTRQVFRRLIANETIVHQGCLRRRSYSAITTPHTTSLRSKRHQNGELQIPHHHHQRRGFFNFNLFRKAKRDIREADMMPGIDRMMELEKMQRMQARPPSPEEVNLAMTKFFKAKWDARQALEDTEAKLTLISLRYLVACEPGRLEALGDKETSNVMNRILRVTSLRPKKITDVHVELGSFLYELIMPSQSGENYVAAIDTYCRLLCHNKQPTQARELLLHHKQDFRVSQEDITSANQSHDIDADVDTAAPEGGPVSETRSSIGPGRAIKLWAAVMRSAVDNDNAQEFDLVLKIIRERALPESPMVRRLCLEWALKHNNVQEVTGLWKEYWRNVCGAADHAAVGITINQLLRWCIANDHLDLGHEVVRDAIQTNPPKLIWDAIFVWAAGTGKGVDEIARMITIMENTNDSISDQSKWRLPDVFTINGLVDFAISKNDPYMAERFIAFGKERGIEPDDRTYVLQIDYRLSVNDVDGALTAYMNLQGMDLASQEDVPAVNRLIVALCNSKRHDFDTIMNVAADLSDRRARFVPETVATLALLHLSRDELHDTIDLLNTHAFHYSSTERAHIANSLLDYILAPSTPTSRAWDAYTILTWIFDETSREPRTRLITNFFSRQRPDMAVHIFTHMRAHSRTDTFPTVDTYITTFLGAAQLRDLEALELVHNQLKLDVNVSVTTKVRNALLMGYTACGRPRKALSFWDDIVASREGPSYNSIHIALRACERSPFGDLKAREIWNRLSRTRVELDGAMWASYVAALAGNGDVGNAMGTVEEADADGELKVDGFTLGSLFGAAPEVEKQAEIERWARTRYPDAWKELAGYGVQENEGGVRLFGIDRSVEP